MFNFQTCVFHLVLKQRSDAKSYGCKLCKHGSMRFMRLLAFERESRDGKSLHAD